MLTAYGRAGDVQSCYKVIDDMERRGLKPEMRVFAVAGNNLQKAGNNVGAKEWGLFASERLTGGRWNGERRGERKVAARM